jgi:hypothetical protein
LKENKSKNRSEDNESALKKVFPDRVKAIDQFSVLAEQLYAVFFIGGNPEHISERLRHC